MLTKVKKWGNSLGLIVPADIVRSQGLREGDTIQVDFQSRIRTIEELGGTIKIRTNLKTLLQEMEEGWDDRQVPL